MKLIRSVTPRNADSELALLERSFRRGSPRAPRWEYEPAPVRPELCRALERLATFVEDRFPLGPVYAARARELCLEASIIESVGTPKVRTLAAQRFVGASEDDHADQEKADELAAAWTRSGGSGIDTQPAGVSVEWSERVRSCDEREPKSLVSRMSSEAGRHRLPMRVVVQTSLASLAATGDGAIFVAAGRWLTHRDVERTVLHEIAGHALPRARASSAPLGLFAIGTARGVDDQEGRALLIEEAAGFLDASRCFELGLRHIGARATLAGATIIEVVEMLLARSARLETAVRIGARVQRGGPGAGGGGLAREIAYLPALVRVRRATQGRFAAVVERMMAGGRIAVDVAPLLATYPTESGPIEGDDLRLEE